MKQFENDTILNLNSKIFNSINNLLIKYIYHIYQKYHIERTYYEVFGEFVVPGSLHACRQYRQGQKLSTCRKVFNKNRGQDIANQLKSLEVDCNFLQQNIS